MELDTGQLLDATLYDLDGYPIGTVSDVYVDDDTGRPEWMLVATGFPPRGSHVPVRGVQAYEDGFQSPYTKDRVKSAPEVDITTKELSEDDEGALYLYYGIPTSEMPSGAGPSSGDAAGGTDAARRDEPKAA
jgi:hypothetical protein